MKKTVCYIFLTGLIFNLFTCKTEVELNAPYEDITVVYGLLNPSDEYHYIIINKAFLGEGNSILMAGIADSNYYTNLNAVIQELSNNTIVNTYTLQDTILNNREPGIFVHPTHKLYYFKQPNLNTNNTYKLIVNISEKNKTVTSRTALVQPFSFSSTIFSIGYANSGSSSNNIYPEPTVKFISSDAKRYEFIVRFKYDEYTPSGVTRKFIDWRRETIFDATPNTEYQLKINGRAFYEYINSVLDPMSGNVTKRVPRAIDYMLYGASEELDAYMNITAPSGGVVQERPNYTNVDNGYGLFSSRFKLVAANRPLTLFSMKELCEGQFTGNLGFCSDSVAYSTQTFYCN